jgi:hypothetical protein
MPNLVTLNPFGYGINANDINRILDPKTQDDTIVSKHVAHFFKIPNDKLTGDTLSRYVKACDAMTNVSVGSYQDDIRNKLINTIASAKRCFSYGEFLACIELCALHAEMLAIFLIIVNPPLLSTTDSLDYDGMNQQCRIRLLQNGILTLEESTDLLKIHNTRINYFHHWHQKHDEIEEDALNSLTIISKVAAKFLEILNNSENLEKIKTYMNTKVKEA